MEEALEIAALGNLDEEDLEYLLLDHILVDRDVAIPGVFDLGEMTDIEIKQNFRFERQDLERLVHTLGIPEDVVTNTRNRVSSLTAICILLRRLAYPNRLLDLCPMFGLSPQSLSQIVQATVTIILRNHEAKLRNMNTLQWLNQNRLQLYADAVSTRGAAIPNCWGFIDGTAREICRPTMQQQEYYSGHKRFHCLKYQSVLAPDGLIVSLKGAYPGRRHDAGIFRESLLYPQLEAKAMFGNDHYVLYGDQAYGVRQLLLAPYGGNNLLPYQINFNRSMRTLRVAVEWGFQKVVSLFAFVDFKKNQKLLLQDLESLYKTSVLLSNCHTCLYGSQTASYFNAFPPSLEEYLNAQ